MACPASADDVMDGRLSDCCNYVSCWPAHAPVFARIPAWRIWPRWLPTPLVMLFGPGSEVLFGASRFLALVLAGCWPAIFPCRQQKDVHHRHVDWALRCFRRFDKLLM
jgi:hypothetical protein